MLVFLDETFREATTPSGEKIPFGALCGVGIPINTYSRVANAVFKLKLDTMGKEYAEEKELKGKKLLSPRTLRLKEQNPRQTQINIRFIGELLNILKRNKLPIFGCVCWDADMRQFTCRDEKVLDITFKAVCERINMYMKREMPDRKAIIVFDNRDIGTDERNAKAMTSYMVRSGAGRGMRSSILEVPLFAISQAYNVGLQLADIVTTIIGIHAEGNYQIEELYNQIHGQLYSWKDNYGRGMSSLRWLDPHKVSPKRQKK